MWEYSNQGLRMVILYNKPDPQFRSWSLSIPSSSLVCSIIATNMIIVYTHRTLRTESKRVMAQLNKMIESLKALETNHHLSYLDSQDRYDEEDDISAIEGTYTKDNFLEAKHNRAYVKDKER